jgi:hypothetical protein
MEMSNQAEIEIIGYSRRSVLDELGVKGSTLRDYQMALNVKKPKGWDYEPNSKGFSASEFEVLKAFKAIVDKRGRMAAINSINQLMETR